MARGVLRVANIIQQAAFGSVVLLEDPELGLEPRAVRRFADFLRWLATPDEGIESSSEKARFVHSAWQDYVADIQSSRKEDANETKITVFHNFTLSGFIEQYFRVQRRWNGLRIFHGMDGKWF